MLIIVFERIAHNLAVFEALQVIAVSSFLSIFNESKPFINASYLFWVTYYKGDDSSLFLTTCPGNICTFDINICHRFFVNIILVSLSPSNHLSIVDRITDNLQNYFYDQREI